ncbi:lipoprotein [Mycoplasma leachii]|uniref:Putative lipoprotein n=1 Tax=Mycoplasma leachii 06049 TaxID=1188244 RepID=A0A2T4I9P9_9MOLU|nr:lipoprotein [Mycoplasma leachii]PTD31264.1 putative lipoprotein [Mycoplasma leachii 06049]
MKKLLTILGSVGLVATTSAAVIACGDKSQQKAPADNKDNNTTEESKKEEKDEKKKEPDYSKVDKQSIGNFQPNSKNSIQQGDIKKKLSSLLGVHESELSKLNVDYTKNSGEVTVTKFNKTLTFTFTSLLELGEFEFKNNTVSLGDIKKKISNILKIDEKYLYELKADGTKNLGSVKSSVFLGTMEFKFTEKK